MLLGIHMCCITMLQTDNVHSLYAYCSVQNLTTSSLPGERKEEDEEGSGLAMQKACSCELQQAKLQRSVQRLSAGLWIIHS